MIFYPYNKNVFKCKIEIIYIINIFIKIILLYEVISENYFLGHISFNLSCIRTILIFHFTLLSI